MYVQEKIDYIGFSTIHSFGDSLGLLDRTWMGKGVLL